MNLEKRVVINKDSIIDHGRPPQMIAVNEIWIDGMAAWTNAYGLAKELNMEGEYVSD